MPQRVECARIILLLPSRCLSNTVNGLPRCVSNRRAKVTFCAYLDAELLQDSNKRYSSKAWKTQAGARNRPAT